MTRAAPADLDRVLAALADPTRRRLLDLLGRHPGSTATTLAAHLPVSRQAVVKHLVVLEGSRLVVGHRAGREVLFRVRPERLAAAGSWMTGLAATWEERLDLRKRKAEGG
ncbi:MAG: ArsR/SmtB family transcription factor [Frankiaceae bacterium]